MHVTSPIIKSLKIHTRFVRIYHIIIKQYITHKERRGTRHIITPLIKLIDFHSILTGSDIIAIILNQKFNVRIGRFFFYFNLVLFGLSFGFLDLDLILYSLVLTFITAQVTDYFLSMFNQRKMVIIISDKSDSIAKGIMDKIKRGVTFLYGRGGFTGKRKKVLMTIVNNYQLKRLEEAVFKIDSDAFFITESTFNVIGRGFSRRKVY